VLLLVVLLLLLHYLHHHHHLRWPCGVIDEVQLQRAVVWSQRMWLFEWWLGSAL